MQSSNDWKIELRTGLGELLDKAVVAGARGDQVFDVVTDELQAMKKAWTQDSDPADDPMEEILDEPANNWPGAER